MRAVSADFLCGTALICTALYCTVEKYIWESWEIQVRRNTAAVAAACLACTAVGPNQLANREEQPSVKKNEFYETKLFTRTDTMSWRQRQRWWWWWCQWWRNFPLLGPIQCRDNSEDAPIHHFYPRDSTSEIIHFFLLPISIVLFHFIILIQEIFFHFCQCIPWLFGNRKTFKYVIFA